MPAATDKRNKDLRQPTLKDIAQITGLTVATVSRILADKEGFAEETVERVRSVADTMGYRPNRLVSALRTGSNGMIGAILPIHAEWGANLFKGMVEAIGKKQFVPIVLDCPSASMSELDMVYHLLDRRVEGVILFPADDTVSDEYFEELHSRGVPLVATVRKLARVNASFVGSDDWECGRLASRHLTGLGHRALGHLAGPQSMSTGLGRAQGFCEESLQIAGCSVSQMVMPNFLPNESLIRDFLKNNPHVTGIFCANEVIALELCRIAKAIGIAIPQQLSVVSHGNGRIAPLFEPSLTSTVEDSETIGRIAAELLLKKIQNKDAKNATHLVQTRLIARNSTAPLLIKA